MKSVQYYFHFSLYKPFNLSSKKIYKHIVVRKVEVLWSFSFRGKRFPFVEKKHVVNIFCCCRSIEIKITKTNKKFIGILMQHIFPHKPIPIFLGTD